jgi:hypothetical protein
MKISTLFIATAMIASPAFAFEDLCTVNMQKLDDRSTEILLLGSPLKEQVEDLKVQAMTAKAEGDLETCGTHSGKALKLLKVEGSENY